MELNYSSENLSDKLKRLGLQSCGRANVFCFFPAIIKSELRNGEPFKVFKIKRNSRFMKIPDFEIVGYFDETKSNRTNIEFNIQPIIFGILWIRFMPLFILAIISCFILHTTNGQGITQLILIDSAILLPWLWTLWQSRNLKKRLELKFIEFLAGKK